MPRFNWDDHPVVNKASFSWDDHPIVTPTVSNTEAALRGAAQGATFGFAPVISGAAQAVPVAAQAATGSKSIQDILDAYNKAREASKAQFDAAQAAHPIVYGAGTLAGSAVPALATGGVSAEAEGAQALAGLSGLSADTVAAGLTGAGYGALSGAGEAASSGASLGQGAKDVAAGTLGGAILGGTAPQVIKGTKYVGNKLSDLGSGALSKIANTETGSTLKSAYDMGKQGENFLNKQTVRDIKQESYDLAKKYLSPGGLLGDLSSEKGKQIGSLVRQAANKEVNLDDSGLSAKIGDLLASFDDRNPEQLADKTKIQEIVDNYLGDSEEAKNSLSPEDLQSFKAAISNVTDYKGGTMKSPQGKNIAKMLTGALGDVTEDYVPGLEEANSGLSNLKAALQAVNVNPDKMSSPKSIKNLSDTIYRQADTVKTGDTARSKFGEALNSLTSASPEVADQFENEVVNTANRIKTVRKATNEAFPGNSMFGAITGASTKVANLAGQTSKGISDGLSAITSNLSRSPKEAIAGLGENLMQYGGDDVEKTLGSILTKAKEKDDVGRNALIFSLMQQPAYRHILTKYLGAGSSESDK